MKSITIENKEEWKSFILQEARYNIPDECKGGLCVDAGCNIGDFEMNNGNRFDKYICFDVFEENVLECIKNTRNLGIKVEVNKLAVWSESDKFIEVMAYQPPKKDNKGLQHFGNSGNIGCVEFIGAYGEGWRKENTIDLVKTIAIDSIIEKYGEINLLKIDVEGSEYKFLHNKDLSKINYIVGEFHFGMFGEVEKNELELWLSKTHIKINNYWKSKTLL